MLKKLKLNVFGAVFISMSMLFTPSSYSADDNKIVIIVNKSNTINKISLKDISNIYLGNKLFWSNSARITPFDFKKKKDESKIFLKEFLKMSSADYSKIWSEKLLSGNGVPPKSLNSSSEVLEAVASNVNSIGFIFEKDLSSNIKKLTVE